MESQEFPVLPGSNVLVRGEILECIRAGKLVVGAAEPDKRVRGCSFDLTVGTIFWGGVFFAEKILSRSRLWSLRAEWWGSSRKSRLSSLAMYMGPRLQLMR